MTVGVSLFSLLTVLASVYVFKVFTRPSIPTGSITELSDGKTTANTTTTTTAPTILPTTTLPTTLGNREFAWTAAQEQQLTNMLEDFGGEIALYYEDLTSGYVFRYNADTIFTAASIVKAPYCMYLLDLASKGECDMSQKVEYTKNIKSDGTGIVKNAEYGTRFTVGQLIECAIRHSDNAALRMLRYLYSAEDFLDYSRTLGIKNVGAIANITGAKINADDMGTYMRAIYNFIQNTPQYGPLLKEHMTHTINPMFSSSYTLIRKYGWAPEAFHDAAIVDAPRPYILVMLTDHADGEKEDFAMFRTVSRTVETFSKQPE